MTQCVACGSELVPVKGCENTTVQFDNALMVDLCGGYGMFFDNAAIENFTVFFCHDCAHGLCEQIPSLGEIIWPRSSHGHTGEYLMANPRHAPPTTG